MKAPKTDAQKAQQREYMKRWRAANPSYLAEWRANNPERGQEYYQKALPRIQEYRKLNRKRSYAYKLKQYGWTPEAFEQAKLDQKGLCAICDKVPTVNKRGGLHADHDHANKTPRALLCNNCNLMLGHAKDQAEVLRKAALYLEKYRTVVK